MLRKLDQLLLDNLSTESKHLPRRRHNLNLHQNSDDPVQKLFIAMQSDSYVRPHRHPEKEKTELFIAIRGLFAILLFDDRGTLLERTEISSQSPVFGAEITPGTWHTVVALQDDSVFFEVKQGSYAPLSDKDFASWAPSENTEGVAGYMQWLKQASPGDSLASF